jgi:fatty-acyl-CoA synthase
LRADHPAHAAEPPQARTTDFSGLKILIGGAAMPEAMAIAAQKRGMDLFTGYGMSETCPVLSLAHLDSADLERRSRSRR